MLNLPVYCELKVHIISAVNQTNKKKRWVAMKGAAENIDRITD